MSITVRASTRAGRNVDPTVYPVEERVGEDILQRWIVEVLRPLVERWLRERGERAFVGADQFVYYRRHAPLDRVAPDVYVLPGVKPDTRVTSWKTWEQGVVPSFALEIVSRDWEKDYIEAPERYRAVGVSELVIFDPAAGQRPDGLAWQVFRRVRSRPLTRVEVSQGDRVRSKTLGCFLRAVGHGDALRLRLGLGPRGDILFATAEEAERAAKEAERAAKEAERAAKEAERAAKEIERAAKEAALARVAELEVELRDRRRRPRH
jgi:hypothetical protein